MGGCDDGAKESKKMKTYIIVYQREIIAMAKAPNPVVARHLCNVKLVKEGKNIEFEKLQAVEFGDNQVLLLN